MTYEERIRHCLKRQPELTPEEYQFLRWMDEDVIQYNRLSPLQDRILSIIETRLTGGSPHE